MKKKEGVAGIEQEVRGNVGLICNNKNMWDLVCLQQIKR